MERIAKGFQGNLGVMMISAGLWTLTGQLVWPFQAVYVLRLGGSYFHIGLIASIGSVVSIVPTIFGGHLADTIGRKKIIYSMSFLLALNALLFAFAPDWKWLIVASIINSLASGVRQPAFNALIADSTREENRAQSYALWSIIPPLFGFASPYLMGVYMDKHGALTVIRMGYVALFTGSSIASIIRYRFLEETLIEPEALAQDLRKISRNVVKGLADTLRELSKPLWILGLMGLFFGFGAAVGGPFWVIYATEDVIHLSLTQWGLIMTINVLTSTIISIPLAKIADHKGRVKLLIPCVVFTPLAIIGFIYSRHFIQTALVSIIVTTLGSMGMTSGQALFADLSEGRFRARINALWSVVGTMQAFSVGASPGSLLGASGNLTGGWMYENLGNTTPLFLQSGMVGLTAITALVYLREPAHGSIIDME